MSATLVKLILLTEVHQELSWRFKWQFKIDEIVDKLAHGVEDDILGEDFGDLHCLRFCLAVGLTTSFVVLATSRLTCCWSIVIVLWATLLIVEASRTILIWSFISMSTATAKEAALELAAQTGESHRRKQTTSSLRDTWCGCLGLHFRLLSGLLLRLDRVVEFKIDQSL